MSVEADNHPSTEAIERLRAWAEEQGEEDGLTSLIEGRENEAWEAEDLIYWCANELLDARKRIAALEEEVAPFRPMSIEEAEKAFNEAEAVALSAEEIEHSVRYTTEPEYRAAYLHRKLLDQHQISRGFKAEIARLRKQLAGPPDAQDPVTEDWLQSMGFSTLRTKRYGIGLLLQDGWYLRYFPSIGGARELWQIARSDGWPLGQVPLVLPTPANRGEVYRLLLVLGVPSNATAG